MIASEQKRQVEYRIGVANLVLDTVAPGVLLYRTKELRMCWDHRRQPPKYDFPARLREGGDWPSFGYRQRSTGGTGFQALAQLIRYVRDLPRLPMVTWEYWASESVKLGTPRTVELLRSGGYSDPRKTCCVLCGDPDFKRGLDWWSLDGIVGPSCRFGECRELPPMEGAGDAR
jgi:hypothetical protein